MPRYRTIRIPDDLVKSIQEIIDDHKELGYRSHSEFIIDAVRRRVEEFINFSQNSSK
ncbi:MAG: CopG family transcriptional regulator [Candidatus Lokiarchaeota archaeon]|nr:CopG family transcriptional regulator [Candidatus Lokiarchaeota archaeon]